jgi:ABC-type nitrate/sulfonate/bicarbonate transport system substrate-binding protein
MNKNMNKKMTLVVIVVLVVIIWFSFYTDKSKAPKSSTFIRIGWQIAWVPEGPLAAILQHTDILKNNGLNPEFQKFTYGAPLAEAALAGNVDVIFVGQVPALSLMSKTDKWEIVGRLLDGRAAIIVPKDSSINTVADLKGKNFSIPFGTLNYLEAIDTLKKNGLNPDKDLSIKNIDAVEVASAVKKGTSKSWGGIDATSLWDPNVALLEEMGLAKTIDEFRLDGVIVMSKDFYNKNPEATVGFLKSMVQAYDYYGKNKEQSNSWYIADTGVNYSSAVLAKAAGLERNNNAKDIKEISLILDQTDINRIQSEADRGFELQILKKQLDAKEVIDQQFVNSAQEEIKNGKYTKKVSITK